MEVFRQAGRGDVPAILDMYDQAVAGLYAKGIDQWDEFYPDHRLLRKDIANGWMYVLTSGEALAAAVVVNRQIYEEYRAAKWSKGRYAVLHRLCVHPARQNKGFGKKTVLYAEALLRSRGVKAVRLDAFTKNPSALRLYESLGYIKAGAAVFRKGEFVLYEKVLLPE